MSGCSRWMEFHKVTVEMFLPYSVLDPHSHTKLDKFLYSFTGFILFGVFVVFVVVILIFPLLICLSRDGVQMKQML